jgi:hypothetical protein
VCVDAAGEPAPFAVSSNLAQIRHAASEFGLQDRVSLLARRGESLHGLDLPTVREVAADAEVLFDISGNLGPIGAALCGCRRVYVDLDPGFTQVWDRARRLPLALSRYDDHVSVALNLGTSRCRIPTAGVSWVTTLPPVVLDHWPAAAAPAAPFRFTSVSTWRTAHGSIELDGRALPLKHHQMRRLMELPEQVPAAEFELALDIDAADAGDRLDLEAHGWTVVNSGDAATPAGFRDYIHRSSGEFSVAQPAYVETHSGWFSDRTAAYLASGRPALVQDTGIEIDPPPGEGLLRFSTSAQAAELAGRIAADPIGHGQAARSFAEAHLDSDVVLGRLLDRLGIGG